MDKQQTFDVIIIGGSYAGLSAAMCLGRALRRVLVLDTSKPCNRVTPHSHNFLTQDGATPAALAAQARTQALAYPTVQLLEEAAVAATGRDGDFTITTETGRVLQARKLFFGTGVRDLLPPRPGFAECWGISLIHCPYCHGYEYHHQPTGMLLNGDMALEHARMLRQWTDQLTIFTDGPATFSPAERAQLASAGIGLEETPVQQLHHHTGELTHVALADRRQVPLAALYLRPGMEQHCLLPQELGCAYTEAGYLQVDNMQKTSVPGITAAGDATLLRSVSAAVAGGNMAGVVLNRELLRPW